MTTGLLRKFSVAYLLLPNILFFIGWFRPAIAVPTAAMLLYMLFREWRKTDSSFNVSTKDLLIISLMACACTFFSSVDGLSSQSVDWRSHNAKFYDLFKNSWPIYFPEVGQYACYYFGYYLVPSFISKIYGELLPALLVIWTFTGYLLGLSWLYILLNKSKIAVIAFFFLRGTGPLIFLILKSLHFISRRPPVITPAIYSFFLHAGSAANQFIPVLIVTCILLFEFLTKRQIEDSFFTITLLFIWAIFPAATLMLILGVLMFHKYFMERPLVSSVPLNWTSVVLLPGIILIPTCLYFLSSQNTSSLVLLWNSYSWKWIALGYSVGFLVDLSMLYIVISNLNKAEIEFPKWLPNMMLTGLFLLSHFRIGKFNDLFYRGSFPFLIILFILILRLLNTTYRTRAWPSFSALYPSLFFLASLMVVDLAQNRAFFRDNKITNHFFTIRPSYKRYVYDSYPNTYQMLMYGYKDKIEANQYLAKKDSFFEKYLCKKKH